MNEEITLRKLAEGVKGTHKAEHYREQIRKEETEIRMGRYARQAVQDRYFRVGLVLGNHSKVGCV